MYAYRLCEVNYALTETNGHDSGMRRGKGSLWISSDSILIKSGERWLYLPGKHIRGAKMNREKLKLTLKNDSCMELNSKNSYMLNALYHYIEGAICRKE